jgi:archaellum component FlaC
LLEGRKKAEAEAEATHEAGSDVEQLQAAMAQIKTLQHDLEQANQSAAQYRAISTASEEALKDLTKNMEAYKKLVEERNNKVVKEQEDLRQRLTQAEDLKQQMTQQLQEMENELAKARSEALDKVGTWKKPYVTLFRVVLASHCGVPSRSTRSSMRPKKRLQPQSRPSRRPRSEKRRPRSTSRIRLVAL